MLAAQLPFQTVGMIAAKDYFFGPKKRRQWLSSLMHLLPLDRSPARSTLKSHIALCRQFLSDKKGVLIFYPEGTRSLTGVLQKLKKGAAQYAYDLDIPLVPVHIQGTYESMPKGRFFPKPRTIRVNIGHPLSVKEAGLSALRQITRELELEILQLKESHG
jgi:1-acyl-sn-glycerol-3-phosphate acyltransferase